MANTFVVVGLQWGDEGKGKIIDLLSPKADIVVRFQGGNNAGHTIVINNEKFVLHLLPSGILNKNITCVIASGVVIDIGVFLKEVESLKAKGRNTDKILISNKAHVIMPYHIKLDELQEESLGENKIGTTKRGIGPCYADKYSRNGIRVADILDEEILKEKLTQNLKIKNNLFAKIYNQEPLSFEPIFEEYKKYAEIIKNQVIDSAEFINEALNDNKTILFEGAQATMLDVDFGTYPYVTSSNPISGSVAVGVGIAGKHIKNVIGVSKVYSTRVGEGPFVTELFDEVKDTLVKVGNEYGSTTKRQRRCGWLDLVVLKYSILLNGADTVVLTKLDVLSSLKEIKVCIAYNIDGKITTTIPATIKELQKATPVYKTFKGFGAIENINKFEDLPIECIEYINFIKDFLKVDIAMISVGPDRNQNIILNKQFITL